MSRLADSFHFATGLQHLQCLPLSAFSSGLEIEWHAAWLACFCQPVEKNVFSMVKTGLAKTVFAGKNRFLTIFSIIFHEFAHLAVHLLSAPASSAPTERIFSNFGYIHSKLRNRLGGAAAAKLVFCYRMLCGSGSGDWDKDSDGPAVSVRSE